MVNASIHSGIKPCAVLLGGAICLLIMGLLSCATETEIDSLDRSPAVRLTVPPHDYPISPVATAALSTTATATSPAATSTTVPILADQPTPTAEATPAPTLHVLPAHGAAESTAPTPTPPPDETPLTRLDPDPSTVEFVVGRPLSFTLRADRVVKVIGNDDATMGANIGVGRAACPEESGGRRVLEDGETITLYPCRAGPGYVILQDNQDLTELRRYSVVVEPAFARLEPDPSQVSFTELEPRTFTVRTNQEVAVTLNPTGLRMATLQHADGDCPGSLRATVVVTDGEPVTVHPCESGRAEIWLYRNRSKSVLNVHKIAVNPLTQEPANAGSGGPTDGEILPERWESLSVQSVMPSERFEGPIELFAWPAGGIAVANRTGRIIAYPEDGEGYDILDLRSKTDIVFSETGLLSAATDPQFSEFPYLYVYYWTRGNHSTRLSRFPVVDGRAVPDQELIILEIRQPNVVHNGGAVRFGSDGMLYLGVGDGGGDPKFNLGQDLTTMLGSIIRIDVRGATADQPYRIPADNPLHGIPNASQEIWAWGLRNPWRMSFDAEGQLWVGDVGTHIDQDEISIVGAGENHGWPVFEGFQCVVEDGRCNAITDVKPLVVNSRADGCAVIGGVVYRGDEIPWLRGAYLFSDFCKGYIWALTGDSDQGWVRHEIAWLDRHVSSFGVDGQGEVYILSFHGPILKLVDHK